MPVIGALTSFANGSIADANDVNANFSAIRDAFNNSAVLTDVAKVITAGHTFSGNQNFTGLATFNGDIDVPVGAQATINDLVVGAALQMSAGIAILNDLTVNGTLNAVGGLEFDSLTLTDLTVGTIVCTFDSTFVNLAASGALKIPSVLENNLPAASSGINGRLYVASDAAPTYPFYVFAGGKRYGIAGVEA